MSSICFIIFLTGDSSDILASPPTHATTITAIAISTILQVVSELIKVGSDTPVASSSAFTEFIIQISSAINATVNSSVKIIVVFIVTGI